MFTQTPNNYQSLYNEIDYQLELDEINTTLVQITDCNTGELLGVKKFYSTQSFSVNVAPIIRPYAIPNTPAIATQFETAERYGYATVKLFVATEDGSESYISTPLTFTISKSNESETGAITKLPTQRLISVGESDSITVRCETGFEINAYVKYYAAADEENSEVLLDSTTFSSTPDYSGIVTFHLLAKEVEGAERIEVIFEQANNQIAQIDYYMVERPNDAIRVAWVSSRGSVEHYTFAQTDAYHEYAESRQIALVSAFETFATRAAIAEMIASPKLWIADGDSYVDGYVVSDYIDTAPIDAIATLSVKIEIKK